VIQDVGDALADGVAPAAPSSEHGEGQMTRLHEQSWGLKGERFPEAMGFPGQMELRQPEGFPEPLGPALLGAFVPA